MLTTELQSLGLENGDTVMLHASMRAIGKEAGPNDVIQDILNVIGPTGTLMMYIDCEGDFVKVGRGKLTPEQEFKVMQNCPAFDSATCPARKDYGIVAEHFRQWQGTICSSNPGARMAACGDKARWITENHPLNYGYGPESPLAKLCELNGKVLLLGSDLDQVTLLHYAEHIAPIENKRIVYFKVPININGKKVWVNAEKYDTSVGIKEWPDRFFATILEKYLKEHNIHSKKVGQADSYLIDAKSLLYFSIPLLCEQVRLL